MEIEKDASENSKGTIQGPAGKYFSKGDEKEDRRKSDETENLRNFDVGSVFDTVSLWEERCAGGKEEREENCRQEGR